MSIRDEYDLPLVFESLTILRNHLNGDDQGGNPFSKISIASHPLMKGFPTIPIIYIARLNLVPKGFKVRQQDP